MPKRIAPIGIGGPVGSGKTALIEAITPRLIELGAKVLVITASWDELTHRSRWLELVDTCLRGAGQVMLQGNPITGLLFLVGIWWAALAVGAPAVGVGALVGLLASTMTAIWTRADASGLRSGLYGFNGVLVGVAVPTFLRPDPCPLTTDALTPDPRPVSPEPGPWP
jgi:hypothetical protein